MASRTGVVLFAALIVVLLQAVDVHSACDDRCESLLGLCRGGCYTQSCAVGCTTDLKNCYNTCKFKRRLNIDNDDLDDAFVE